MLLLVATVALTVALASSQPASPSRSARGVRQPASIRSLSSTSVLPADCVPNPAGPPAGPYQFGFVAEVGPRSGQPSYLEAGPNFEAVSGTGQPVAEVNNITAKICGVATIVPGPPGCPVEVQITVPPDGQKFGPLTATILTIPGLTPGVPVTPQTQRLGSTVGCSSSVNGLVTTTVAVVVGNAGLFGLACGIDLTVDLTATITGPLDPGDGSLSLHGMFIARDFGLPAVSPSTSCPAGVVSNLNTIAGLPLSPGHAILVLPFVAATYLPAQQ